MGIWKPSASSGRGQVVPVNDDDEQSTYSPLAKHHQRSEPVRPPVPRRRLLPGRGWLGCFFLINTFAIAGFIFASAWYFPSTSTTGIVEQTLKQGDVSLLELPPRDNGDRQQEQVKTDERLRATATFAPKSTTPVPNAPSLTTAMPQSEPEKSLFRSDKELTKVEEREIVDEASRLPEPKHPIRSEITSTTPVTLSVAAPVETPKPTTQLTESEPKQEAPVQSDTTSPVKASKSQSMEEVLRLMTGTQAASNSPRKEPTGDTPKTPSHQHQEQLHSDLLIEYPHRSGAEETNIVPRPSDLEPTKTDFEDTNPTDAQDLELNLITWLKADAGVEVKHQAECAALGSSCEVISWKSAARSHVEPVVFHPVDVRMRPVLQPVSQNDLPTVSFSCGMVHVDGIVLHEKMTLFFVLSPSRVELGDSYRAQKFFGNAPYGQFLLHGGKPAFFTAGGLVESNFVATNDEFMLTTYRLHQDAVEIKVNGEGWNPMRSQASDSFRMRISSNGVLSLGNVKSVCDTNAFDGRIAEILIYDTALSDHRVILVEKYLRFKWWGDKPPPSPDQVVKDSKPSQVDPVETTAEPTVPEATTAALPVAEDVSTPFQPHATEPVPGEATGEVPPQESEKTEDQPQLNPRAFDSEGVFEWLPSTELLQLIKSEQGNDPSHLVEKWKQTVAEKIALVHNFQFGGEILRTFIRERRDELLTLREELFGG